MPQTAEWIDDMRQHFPTAYVTYARENGKAVGKPSPQGVVPYVEKPKVTTTRNKR